MGPFDGGEALLLLKHVCDGEKNVAEPTKCDVCMLGRIRAGARVPHSTPRTAGLAIWNASRESVTFMCYEISKWRHVPFSG